MQISFNKTKRKEKPKYIVIHDTGNKGAGANAMSHFNYFNSGDRQSSADVFCDDGGAIKVNDYNTFYTWHCGDGKGKNGITNSNSVGIEICINSDGDYDMAVREAMKVTRRLMKELKIPAEKVVRHYDASGKLCPKSMSDNNWEGWLKFKEAVTDDEKYIKLMAGLEDSTMNYLKSYTYGKDLLRKLAEVI